MKNSTMKMPAKPGNNAAMEPGTMGSPAGTYKDAKMPMEAMKTGAYMTNNGEAAKDFARGLTKGLDAAFPVK
jgi:hypothetical protein